MSPPVSIPFSQINWPAEAELNHDIVVIGGGMAGVMAALAAKTTDNRVLLIESSNVLGGQGTAGGVAGFCGDTARVNAPFDELVARLSRHNLIEPYRPNDDRRGYDLEWCAFFLQEMVLERGIDVLLHTRVVAGETEQGKVNRLLLSTAGGLLTCKPRFVVDASGSCIVAVLTGFPYLHEGAYRQLPMSLYFTLWDTKRPVTPILPEGCPRWRHDDEIPMTSLHRFPTGKVEVKMKVVGFDAADGVGRSAAEIFARRQMHGLIYYLQTVGYRGRKLDTHVLASVARSIGVREERRIVGEHLLTEAECRNAAIFPDAVAVNTYHIDYHWPDRMERAGTGITDMLDPHHLPLRMMIPKGAKNLLVAGRGASSEQAAMSAFRVMAVVAQLGFAAGHAARLCVESGTDVQSIDVPRLQRALVAGGQSLDLSDYGGYLRNDIFTQEPILPEPSPFASCDTPAMTMGRNAKFIVAWSGVAADRAAPASIWITTRLEKKWSAPRRVSAPLATALGSPRFVSGEDGTLCLRFRETVSSPVWWEIASADDGDTWSEPRHASASPEDDEQVVTVLSENELAKFAPEESTGKISFAYSNDSGTSWEPGLGIEPLNKPGAAPAAVVTRTGLAVVYVARGNQLEFWHGSLERMRHGAPAARAHVLKA